MKFSRLLIAAAALAATMGANAQVTGSLGGGFGTFLSLSAAGLNGGSVATLVGGTVLNSDQPFADIPKGGVFGGNFLSAGPSTNEPATLSFTGGGLDYVSFLWGSPDTYNILTVNSTAGSQVFTAAGLGFPVTNGDQSFSQYVQFSAGAGVKITSLNFVTLPSIDAFEVANFSITPVPEPETYALMLAGLGAMAFLGRRRRS